MIEENRTDHEFLNKQNREKALKLLEKAKEKSKDKPVKYIPMGFSYDIEKLKEQERRKNLKKIKTFKK